MICHQLENHLENHHHAGDLRNDQCIDYCLKYIDLLTQTHEQLVSQKNQLGNIEKNLNEISAKISTQKYTALIIESSRLQLDLLKQSLSPLPLSIDNHNNGLKALELLLHKKYDIVITGMEIDELNGEALISAMRLSKSINKNSKAILITSKNFKKLQKTSKNLIE